MKEAEDALGKKFSVASLASLSVKADGLNADMHASAEYRANDGQRCFHCKSELYRISAKKQVEWGMNEVVNGTNLDGTTFEHHGRSIEVVRRQRAGQHGPATGHDDDARDDPVFPVPQHATPKSRGPSNGRRRVHVR